jgi:hypothetical protein
MTDIGIDRRLLQIIFDTAVHSMDFGSGFLDDEEVTALRAVAVLLGVDPLVATPDNFKCKHLGHCVPYSTDPNVAEWQRRCRYCRR